MAVLPRYQLRLLGKFQLSQPDGKAIAFATRKIEALLTLLALSPGFRATRESIIGLLWSTRDEAQARGSLRQALFVMRKTAPGLLVEADEAERDTIELAMGSINCDVRALLAALTSGEASQLPEAAHFAVGPLLDGYAGVDPAFDEWLVARRREITEQIMQVHERAALHLLSADDAKAAIFHGLKLVELDPLRESSHRLLMTIHATSGNRALALQHYQTLEQTLRIELGVYPDSESQALHAKLINDKDFKPAIVRANPVLVPPALNIPAIAVLPFRNLSDDTERNFFSEGITEDLVTALSRGKHFPVIGRQTMQGFQDTALTPAEIGQSVGARYLVEGTVRRASGRLRLTACVVDSESRHEVWSKQFDRQDGDLFSLQDELTNDIVHALSPSISNAEQNRARNSRNASLDSWEKSQLAFWHIRRGAPPDYETARRLLEQVISEQPEYSYPRGLLALCIYQQSLSGWTEDPPTALRGVLKAARDAVAIDDEDWLAHALLGIAQLWSEQRHDLSRLSLQHALDLNPYASLAQHLYGCVCGFSGDLVEAERAQLQVLRFDPNFQFQVTLLADLALEYYLRGDHDGAVRLLDEALMKQPKNARSLQRKLAAMAMKGDTEESRKVLAELKVAQPNISAEYFAATYPFRIAAHREMFLEGLRRGGLEV